MNDPSDAPNLSLVPAPAAPSCGGCTHWRENPPDPNALGVRAGRCCEGPPQVFAIMGPQSRLASGLVQAQVQIQSMYPPCALGNEACDRFSPREEP